MSYLQSCIQYPKAHRASCICVFCHRRLSRAHMGTGRGNRLRTSRSWYCRQNSRRRFRTWIDTGRCWWGRLKWTRKCTYRKTHHHNNNQQHHHLLKRGRHSLPISQSTSDCHDIGCESCHSAYNKVTLRLSNVLFVAPEGENIDNNYVPIKIFRTLPITLVHIRHIIALNTLVIV